MLLLCEDLTVVLYFLMCERIYVSTTRTLLLTVWEFVVQLVDRLVNPWVQLILTRACWFFFYLTNNNMKQQQQQQQRFCAAFCVRFFVQFLSGKSLCAFNPDTFMLILLLLNLFYSCKQKLWNNNYHHNHHNNNGTSSLGTPCMLILLLPTQQNEITRTAMCYCVRICTTTW